MLLEHCKSPSPTAASLAVVQADAVSVVAFVVARHASVRRLRTASVSVNLQKHSFYITIDAIAVIYTKRIKIKNKLHFIYEL